MYLLTLPSLLNKEQMSLNVYLKYTRAGLTSVKKETGLFHTSLRKADPNS